MVDKLEKSDDRLFSIEKSYFPLALVVTLVTSAAYVASVVTNERARIDTRITEVATQISGVQMSLDKFTKVMARRATERWSRADMLIWCMQAERENTAFKCPKFDPKNSIEMEDEANGSR